MQITITNNDDDDDDGGGGNDDDDDKRIKEVLWSIVNLQKQQ